MTYNYKKNAEATRKALANSIGRNVDKLSSQIEKVGEIKSKKK